MAKEEMKEKKVKERDTLVTCRVLFVSILDKIYLWCLILSFVLLTANNFAGDIANLHYGFWAKVGNEVLIIIGTGIAYLILNWFYKCAVKTMLCLTEKEVYKEAYVPFKRSETTIPLNKITGVSTINVFWIFRSIIIHQYGKLPMIFFTWNNQEFKDKLDELVVKEDKKIRNEFEDKNIITEDKLKFLKYFAITLAGIICFIGILRFVLFIFGTERRIVGTYEYSDNYNTDQIVLVDDGTCDVDDIISSSVTECEWVYNNDTKKVEITYESGYYYKYDDTIELEYNFKEKTLQSSSRTYTKID